MTQEKANKIFETELGQQVDVLFSTSDGQFFIRESEALHHSENLDDKSIKDWYKGEEELNFKPIKELYGWNEKSLFDDLPSGWQIEGGEEAYYKALELWEQKNK